MGVCEQFPISCYSDDGSILGFIAMVLISAFIGAASFLGKVLISKHAKAKSDKITKKYTSNPIQLGESAEDYNKRLNK